MKYRSDFVTNSSSSSFVVAFKTRPKSVEEVKKLLFGDVEEVDYLYNYKDDKQSFSTLDMATTVFNDIKSQQANNLKKIQENLPYREIKGCPNHEDYKIPKNKIKKPNDGSFYSEYDWEAYQKDHNAFAEKECKKFMEKFKNFKLYCFDYSDNDGSMMCHMEHGDIFKNLNHVRKSNH